jgi:hypothetical protein
MHIRRRFDIWKEVLWRPAIWLVIGAYGLLSFFNWAKGEFMSQPDQEKWQIGAIIARWYPRVAWYWLAIGALAIVTAIVLEGAYRAAARRDRTIGPLRRKLDDSETFHENVKVNLLAKILALEKQQTAGTLPELGNNELRHPNAPKGPGTMLWRWVDGDVVGPFCPIHKDPLLYRFVGTTGPFDDESWLGSGGVFYCPTDNQEVFRYNVENHGAKVKNVRAEVRQRFEQSPMDAHFIDRVFCWRLPPEFFRFARGSQLPQNQRQLDELVRGPFCPTCGLYLVQQAGFLVSSVVETVRNPCACGWRNDSAVILGMDRYDLKRAIYLEAQRRLNTQGPDAFAAGPCPDTGPSNLDASPASA